MLRIPIEPERLVKPSALQRMTNRMPRQHYYARAKNRVIRGPGFANEVASIDEEYAGSLADDFKAQWLGLLEEIIAYLARDGHFDSDEKEFVKEFIRVFGLKKPEIESAYRRGVTHAFAEIVRTFASDGDLSESELERLDIVAKRFGLLPEDRQDAVETALASVVNQALDEILADEMISAEEWESFQALCARLGIDPSVDPERRSAIEAARQRWWAMYGELQPIEVRDFRLPKNEQAFCRCQVTMFEQRRVRTAGEYEDRWTPVADGELILTNLRLLLRGSNANNKAIKWDAVAGIEAVGQDGMFVEKYRGKSPVFKVDTEVELSTQGDYLALIAQRLFEGR